MVNMSGDELDHKDVHSDDLDMDVGRESRLQIDANMIEVSINRDDNYSPKVPE